MTARRVRITSGALTPGHGQGFTLIEVLVAVLVLSIGVLGLVGLHSAALRNNQSAYQRSQAAILINDMADKMRSNMAIDYSAITAVSHATSCVSYSGTASSCSATEIAERDLYDWQDTLSTVLPSGSGVVTVSGAVTTVVISWDDDRDAGTADETIAMSFQL